METDFYYIDDFRKVIIYAKKITVDVEANNVFHALYVSTPIDYIQDDIIMYNLEKKYADKSICIGGKLITLYVPIKIYVTNASFSDNNSPCDCCAPRQVCVPKKPLKDYSYYCDHEYVLHTHAYYISENDFERIRNSTFSQTDYKLFMLNYENSNALPDLNEFININNPMLMTNLKILLDDNVA